MLVSHQAFIFVCHPPFFDSQHDNHQDAHTHIHIYTCAHIHTKEDGHGHHQRWRKSSQLMTESPCCCFCCCLEAGVPVAGDFMPRLPFFLPFFGLFPTLAVSIYFVANTTRRVALYLCLNFFMVLIVRNPCFVWCIVTWASCFWPSQRRGHCPSGHSSCQETSHLCVGCHSP